jgi:hypothetical protein
MLQMWYDFLFFSFPQSKDWKPEERAKADSEHNYRPLDSSLGEKFDRFRLPFLKF